jgi:hypothetical protein
MAIQRATGRGLSELRTAIGQGDPIFEREIFAGDYAEHASMIRAVVRSLEDAAIESRIYELREGETIESCTHVDNCRISVEVLNNILHQADVELDRQLGQ